MFFAVVFFASKAGKKHYSKAIFHSAEGEKRCLRTPSLFLALNESIVKK